MKVEITGGPWPLFLSIGYNTVTLEIAWWLPWAIIMLFWLIVGALRHWA